MSITITTASWDDVDVIDITDSDGEDEGLGTPWSERMVLVKKEEQAGVRGENEEEQESEEECASASDMKKKTDTEDEMPVTSKKREGGGCLECEKVKERNRQLEVDVKFLSGRLDAFAEMASERDLKITTLMANLAESKEKIKGYEEREKKLRKMKEVIERLRNDREKGGVINEGDVASSFSFGKKEAPEGGEGESQEEQRQDDDLLESLKEANRVQDKELSRSEQTPSRMSNSGGWEEHREGHYARDDSGIAMEEDGTSINPEENAELVNTFVTIKGEKLDKKFNCKENGCNAQFHYHFQLRQHAKKSHGILMSWMRGCRRCGAKFPNQSLLRFHQNRKHGSPWFGRSVYNPRRGSSSNAIAPIVELDDTDSDGDYVAEPSLKRRTRRRIRPVRYRDGISSQIKGFSAKKKRGQGQRSSAAAAGKNERSSPKNCIKSKRNGAFKCDVCTESFCLAIALKHHTRKCHNVQDEGPSSVTAFICSTCRKEFFKKEDMTNHYKKNHLSNESDSDYPGSSTSAIDSTTSRLEGEAQEKSSN